MTKRGERQFLRNCPVKPKNIERINEITIFGVQHLLNKNYKQGCKTNS